MITPTLLYTKQRTIEPDIRFPACVNWLTIKDVDAARRVELEYPEPPDH